MKKIMIPVLLMMMVLVGCRMNTRNNASTNTPNNSSTNTQDSSSMNTENNSSMNMQNNTSSNTQNNSSMSNIYQELGMDKVADWLENETDYIILDVRSEEEYISGHMPNAINIPNEKITDQEIAELPNKDQKILVYCRSGNRSKLAAEKLANMGYTNIIEIGGINDWQGELVKETE